MLNCKICGKELIIVKDKNPYDSDVYYIGFKVVCGECFKKNKENN